MTPIWRCCYWHLGLASWLVIGGAIANGDCAKAQITTAIKREAEPSGFGSCLRRETRLQHCTHHTAFCLPDATLGAESSVVTPTNINGLPTEQIDGGATRGANLFHSFEQFSIPTGGAAHFNNALNIQNIISRKGGRAVAAV